MNLDKVYPHPEKDDLKSTGVEHEVYDIYEPSEAEKVKVQNTVRRYVHYRDKRQEWHDKACEDLDFANLKQWEDWEEEELIGRG